MALGLGNNLIRNGGSLNPDGLSLDLQFAADKTLTARKGPTPTFTRASTATFVGSDGLIQSAAVNAARFDHDPLTLACKGLLIEESRTNQIIQSEALGTTWSTDAGRVAVATDVIASPSGATTADKITENNSIIDRRILINVQTAVASTVYTYSCYLKAGERDFAQLAFGTNFGNQYQNFIIGGVNAGTLGSGSGITSPQIIALPNGWYRCTATITSAGAGATQVTIGPADSSTLGKWGSYLGTVGSGIYAWGAQLEAGSFPTSYIPTTTAALARSADVCSITGADVHPSNGTLVVEFDRRTLNLSVFRSPGRVSASASVVGADSVGIDHNDVSIRTPIRASATTLSTLISSNESLGNTKVAVAWSSGDSAHVSGGIVRASTSTEIAFTNPLDTISFCGIPAAAISTTISSIRYYKKRLSNAKLAQLTA